MSFSRRRMLKAAGYFVAGIAATNARKAVAFDTLNSQSPANTQTDSATQIALASQSGWVEKILNSDGTINWTQYANVANNYDQPDIINYRLGPDYNFYHSSSESIPKLWGPTTDGFIGNSNTQKIASSAVKRYEDVGGVDWFAMSGQLVFLPDSTAAAEYQPGVARARNGSIYIYDTSPEYGFDMRVQWTRDAVNHYNHNPDAAVKQQSLKDASGGSVPAPPIATARTKAAGGVTGFLLFKNGLISATGTGNDGYTGDGGSLPYSFIKLGAGKVPTAAAVTPGNEFLLVTLWDTNQRIGKVAVIAIKGCVVGSDRKLYHWGFPSWPTIRGMKLLGYVDLPFAAPTAISTSVDHVSGFGRGFADNVSLDLNSQTERDTWYNWSGSQYKKTARSGYAVVVSRAESKAAFIDLQPLLQYYRKMYFTTQANYDQTKNEGNDSKQWPYRFSYVSEQTPKVVSTINVKQPTAVATGLPRHTAQWRDTSNTYKQNAYIATMDGELRMYKVGNLMTTDSGGTIGEPFNIVKVGKNPTNIDYGSIGTFTEDLFINCRGDKAIYYLYYDGTIHATLRDSRLQDPVYVAVSNTGRRGYRCPILSVMDFEGKQVVNYRYENGAAKYKVPVGNPAGSSVFEYGYATSLPGKPFMFTLSEVI